jgi:hypothetical protein
MRLTDLTLWAALAAAAAVSSGGCKDAHVHEAFFPDLNDSQTKLAMGVQTARGARIDATLYGIHFDGVELNSLGQAKLDLMLEGGGGGADPITVYISAAVAEADQHRAAVERYLTHVGLEQGRFQTVAGPNPRSTHPASESLSRLKKTENPQAEQSAEATMQSDAGAAVTTPVTAAQ